MHVEPSPELKLTLGAYLASIRKDRKMSLRAVEEATEKAVSNAYLSQIENDKIQRPSPNVLYKLADIYAISYEQLMEMAGYIVTSRRDDERHGRVATFAEHELSQQEEAELLDYLQHLRSKKRRHGQT